MLTEGVKELVDFWDEATVIIGLAIDTINELLAGQVARLVNVLDIAMFSTLNLRCDIVS